MQKAWSSDRLTYEGRFNTYRDVEVLPKPLQNPMPTWIGVSSQDAIDWAASQGHAILMDPHSTHNEIGRKYARYRATLPADSDGRTSCNADGTADRNRPHRRRGRSGGA